MYTHLIFIVNCDSENPSKKIAYDEILEEGKMPVFDPLENVRDDKGFMKKIGFYMKSVDGGTVKDLLREDPYFRNIHFCKTVDEFIAQERD